MLKEGLTRRQFVGGTAALAGAAAVPTFVNVSTAVAAADFTFPIATPPTTGTNANTWIPLDPVKAARNALEIYRGMRVGQGG
jgi:hypothetical protein